jgi:uracil DNA glycosylase
MSVTRGFYGNQHFLLANEYLQANGKTPINW